MTQSPPGLLIVLEGIDGAGKTTQADRLQAWLEEQGHRVTRSREPTQGPYGQKLRRSMSEGRLSPDEELDLFLKDRKDHVERLINPTRAKGDSVLLDRYYFSTIAYQGARGYDPADLQARNEAFAPAPDLLFILDLSPEVSLERIRHSRGDAPDTFEVPELLRKSRGIFLALAQKLPYAHVIDATKDPEHITTEMIAIAQKAQAQR